MLAYKLLACEVSYFGESLNKHLKSIANRRVEDWEANNGHIKDTTRLFPCPWHDPVGEHICAQPFRMWNRLRFHPFLQASQIFQRRKSDANKQDFEIGLNLTCQAQSVPKTTGILTKVFCTSGPNLVVLAWRVTSSKYGQAQNMVTFDSEIKFDLEDQGQSHHKAIGFLTKFFYAYGLNLVILACTGPEWSCGQTNDWHTDWQTHRHTDAGNENTRMPILASVIIITFIRIFSSTLVYLFVCSSLELFVRRVINLGSFNLIYLLVIYYSFIYLLIYLSFIHSSISISSYVQVWIYSFK